VSRLPRTLLVAVATLLAVATAAGPAWADGDPGSDVLVYQSYFVGSDSGISIPQQLRLGNLLDATRRTAAPVRVAIIAHPDDLGAITPLWLKPQLYARFLGIELSLAYSGQLLVVMPDGFGYNWPGHAVSAQLKALAGIRVGAGPSGLLGATDAAVLKLEALAGVKLPAGSGAPTPAGAGAGAAAASTAPTAPAGAPPAFSGSGSDSGPIIAAVLIVLGAAGLGVAVARRGTLRLPVVVLSAGPLAILAGVIVLGVSHTVPTPASTLLAENPDLDPGTTLSGRPAPNFTLTDQFGHRISLSDYRGKVVLLDFNDAECTTICPLTTTAMLDAKRMLGPAAAQVQLLGVDANSKSTSIEDVLSYSQLHGLVNEWHFMTGSLAQLKAVWKEYGIAVDVTRGLISHTPALFVIDPRGRLQKVFVTQQSYAAVGQLGQLLAKEASRLLPTHPAVRSDFSYAQIRDIAPADNVALPRSGGGSVRVGPASGAHLFMFFATWDQEVSPLPGDLDRMNEYAAAARTARLPSLIAVDEGSVEPSPSALPDFLATLPRRLDYPVAIDVTGRLADGYEVQGQPWFVLVSRSGRILWYQDGYSSGWPTPATLIREVKAGLARGPAAPANADRAQRELAGSPAPLAALHVQADQLLGPRADLAARIRALRGYPIVVNAWASWCTACQAEFSLLASAAAHYGRRVAFLGVDTDDTSPQDAVTFLKQHYVSYPSYQMAAESGLRSLYPPGILGLPTTFFINRAGRVVHVQSGEYASQGVLDQDIESYALGG